MESHRPQLVPVYDQHEKVHEVDLRSDFFFKDRPFSGQESYLPSRQTVLGELPAQLGGLLRDRVCIYRGSIDLHVCTMRMAVNM